MSIIYEARPRLSQTPAMANLATRIACRLTGNCINKGTMQIAIVHRLTWKKQCTLTREWSCRRFATDVTDFQVTRRAIIPGCITWKFLVGPVKCVVLYTVCALEFNMYEIISSWRPTYIVCYTFIMYIHNVALKLAVLPEVRPITNEWNWLQLQTT